jgi:hypothetical protein
MPDVARRPATLLLAGMLAASLAAPAIAMASSVSAASFSGGTGTAVVSGTLYARSGGALQLSVTTDAARCVDVSGAFTATRTAVADTTTWAFDFTAGTGDGPRQVTVTAWSDAVDGACAGTSGTTATAGFTLDNTGPTLIPARAPSPNAAGWNKGTVMVSFIGFDTGSGLAASPSPASVLHTAETGGTVDTSTATDKVGNTTTVSVTVKLDKTAPSAPGAPDTAANAAGWHHAPVTVSFACADALSLVKTCTAPTTLSSDGAGQSVSGSATDNADNASLVSTVTVNLDTTAPSLDGAPTTGPNGNGWYAGDVTVHWTASDGLSGLDGSAPDDSTITGEGSGLTAEATVRDVAGNETTAHSPGVDIDRTGPKVALVGGPVNGASYGADTLPGAPTCDASDALSGVDGACEVEGYATTPGTHTITATARDKAGNASQASVTYSVGALTLVGFYRPVDMGSVNAVKGGSTIPLKFEVFDGETELTSTDAIEGFTVDDVACPDARRAGRGPVPWTTSGGAEIRYDEGSGRFEVPWLTPRTAGACLRLTLSTTDGSTLSALFRTR